MVGNGKKKEEEEGKGVFSLYHVIPGCRLNDTEREKQAAEK